MTCLTIFGPGQFILLKPIPEVFAGIISIRVHHLLQLDLIKENLFMTHEEIKQHCSIYQLKIKSLCPETLPDLARDLAKEPVFMMQLFPVLLGILKESGMDLSN